jgi:energy-converting hydrogenase Eha subunit E
MAGAHNIIKGTHGSLMCTIHYDWVVRSIFLFLLKLQGIDNKLARLLKLEIPHVTFNFVFWGFDDLGPSEALVICKLIKLKE